MTAAEYKSRRTALGHTQQTLADVLGLARVTIARRETGALPITTEAELALLGLKKTKHAPPRAQNNQGLTPRAKPEGCQ